MTLYIVRHQESIANAKEIISGKDYDLPLTHLGVQSAYALAKRLKDIVENKPLILSSPFIRAKQTAQIIAEKFSVTFLIEPSIQEVYPGIIQGPKSDDSYLIYRNVWEKRGDLDEIPKAESGNELQARVIYFLERYLSPRDDEIIVSHAGFNKSLVNTILGNDRTNFLDSSYNKIHILDNVWGSIEYEKLSLAKSSEAYVVKTKNGSYVLKKIPNISYNQLKLQKDISDFSGENLMSKVLFQDVKGDYAVQVLNYFEGVHKYGRIINRNELISSVYRFSERIKNFPGRLEKSLDKVMTRTVNSIKDPSLKKLGKMLLDNKRFAHILNEDKQILVHYDLHRSNIIFTDNGIRFLDLGTFMLAPEQFQPASFFMASLLLEELEDFNLESTLSQWPEQNLSREDIILLMKSRAIMGCSFFQSINNKSVNEKEIYERYLKSISLLNRL